MQNRGKQKGFELRKVVLNGFEPVSKVSRPNSVTHPNQTPIFEWCVVKCGSKYVHQKDMCLRKIVNHSSLNDQHTWENLYDIQ